MPNNNPIQTQPFFCVSCGNKISQTYSEELRFGKQEDFCSKCTENQLAADLALYRETLIGDIRTIIEDAQEVKNTIESSRLRQAIRWATEGSQNNKQSENLCSDAHDLLNFTHFLEALFSEKTLRNFDIK